MRLCFTVPQIHKRLPKESVSVHKFGMENGDGSRRVSRVPTSKSCACLFAAALKVALLLSFAVCTHLTSADEHMERGDATVLKQFASARGRERADSAALFSRLVAQRSRPVLDSRPARKSSTGSLDTDRSEVYHSNDLQGDLPSSSGVPGGKLSEILSHVGEYDGIIPDEGQLRTRRPTALSNPAVLDMREESLREFDVKLQGVVGLGTSPPEGSLPGGAIAGWPMGAPGSERNRHTDGSQPKVVLLDMFGQKQNKFCPDFAECTLVDHPVTAAIFNNPGCGKLYGTTTVQSVNGVATFTDLMIDSFQSRYRMKFTAGLLISPVTAISPPFKVAKGQIYIPDDVLWNFAEAGAAECRGCDDITFCSLSSPRTYSPPWTHATRKSIDAGSLIRSDATPGVGFQPCAGYEYPTVWVRKYIMDEPSLGSEYDGWEDVPNWDYDIEIKIEEPGCMLFDGDDDLMVCRRGLEAEGGSKIRRADDFKANKGAPSIVVFDF